MQASITARRIGDECALDLQVGLNVFGTRFGPPEQDILERGDVVTMDCPSCALLGCEHVLRVFKVDDEYVVV